MTDVAPQSLVSASLRGCCPRCAQPTLFKGWLTFAGRCRHCGLDFSGFNVGDGPAAFLTMILGAMICLFALTVQLKLAPPFWVHVVLWVPLLTLAVIGSLRVSKAAMLILEHRNEVREGRLDTTSDDQEPS